YEASGLSTIERCSKLFRDGREETEDKPRPGRPITETTTENIEQVRLFIDDNPYMTTEDIQKQTHLSYGTVQRIISDHTGCLKSFATLFILLISGLEEMVIL
ncbi:unnamed protein product, partial [Adineta ricciae]